jgi:dihydroorotate dehydrogenase (NAD+) catalytic subunit
VLAGASAVQIGTILFNDPSALTRVSTELSTALAARGIDRLRDAVGLAHRPPALVVPEEPDPPGDDPVVEEPVPRAITFEDAQ